MEARVGLPRNGSARKQSVKPYLAAGAIVAAALGMRYAFSALSGGTRKRSGLALEVERLRAMSDFGARWGAAMAASSDAIFLMDAVSRKMEYNEAALHFLRLNSASEFPGDLHSYRNLISVSDYQGRPLPFAAWPLSRVLRGESDHNLLLRVQRKDTGERWIASYSFSPFRDSQNKVKGVLIIARDVSEQIATVEAAREGERKAEQAKMDEANLQRSSLEQMIEMRTAELLNTERRYRELFENCPVGIVVQSADGVIIEGNKAACSILHISMEQLMGRTSFDPNWKSVKEDGSPFPGHEHPAMVTLRTGGALNNVLMGLGDEGERTWISINSYPIYTAGQTLPTAVTTTFFDVTERVQRDKINRESAQRLQGMVSASPHDIALCSTDLSGTITYFSQGAEKMTGYSSAEVVGKMKITQFFAAEQFEEFINSLPPAAFEIHDPVNRAVAEVIRSGTLVKRWLIVRKNGTAFHSLTYVSPIRSDAGSAIGLLATVLDTSSEHDLELTLRNALRYDDLTGALRVGAFTDDLNDELKRIKRSGRPAALIMMDLDGFKTINDTLGHASGDQYLKQLTSLMLSSFRSTDVIGRVGGDEFCILLPETGTEAATMLCRKLLVKIARLPATDGDRTLYSAASMGITLLVPSDTGTDMALQRADKAMYRAKSSGGNSVQVITSYDPPGDLYTS